MTLQHQNEPTMAGQKEKRSQEWADEITDDEEETEYEPTYRDGSAKNECWAGE